MRTTILALAMAAIGSIVALPQAATPRPVLSLAISASKEQVASGERVVIQAQEANLSNGIISAGRDKNPSTWYKMEVTRDGIPAELTEQYKHLLHPDPNSQRVGGTFSLHLKPGEMHVWEVPLTNYFTLATPGVYEITFSKNVNTEQGGKTIVRSNTIRLTVGS
ncbi:MAG TPA: hypothetical protein VGN16_23795 [Acidobacteriaceae bacterium]